MEEFPLQPALWNLLLSTAGNIIGGALVLGVPVFLLEQKKA